MEEITDCYHCNGMNITDYEIYAYCNDCGAHLYYSEYEDIYGDKI